MKIPFTLDAWLKDKSQKVETRDGRLVHDIWRVKEPSFTNNRKTEVCALIDGEEDALVFFVGGRYLPTAKDTDSPFDLFIITPEPELSEFEKEYIRLYNEGYADGQAGSKPISDDNLKEYAAELFELAKKELCESGEVTDWYAKGKAEALKEIEQDPESSYAFKRGVEYGKEEALKDLPRWKKCAPCDEDKATIPAWIVRFDAELAGESAVVHNVHYILFGDLEKLPKEE